MNRRLCFVTLPFAGHINPLLPLALGAQEAGYDVEVVTGEAKLAVVEAAGLRASVLRSISTGVFKGIFNTGGEFGRGPARVAAQFRAAFALLRAIRDELSANWRETPPDLVVADFASVPVGLAADPIGIPWITIIRGGFFLEGRDYPPPFLGGLTPMPGVLGQIRDAAGSAALHHGKDVITWLLRREMAQLGLRWRRADGSESIYSNRAILAQDMAELEFPRAWPAALRFIGPMAENPEPPLALQQPAGRPRVLVTLGTHLRVAKRTLVEEVRALAQRLPETQFVISLGDSGARSAVSSHEEPGLTVYPFVPYRAEIPSYDAVIHHGGPGIIGAAIAEAKPSLIKPHIFDQFDFAARIEHHGLGLRARQIGSDEAAAKLRRLLHEPWPALPVFAAAAARYRPVESFLETVEAQIGGPVSLDHGATARSRSSLH